MNDLAHSLVLFVLLAGSIACAPIEGGAGSTADGDRRTAVATFAGGCFWCMEGPFEKLDGVRSVISGYTGGVEKNPTYKQVARGSTGHTEAVQVTYDPRVVSFEDLLAVYWRSMDPTDADGQFADRGPQYRPGIFYHDEGQRIAAERSRRELAGSGRFSAPIVVEIVPYRSFYPAEDYHQDYSKKNPNHYERYRKGSGRASFLERSWADEKLDENRKKAREWRSFVKPADAELRAKLSPLQYRVTQMDGTERAFANPYWENEDHGIYVDIVSGEPLFSSRDKYASGTGWPSFVRPLVATNVVQQEATGNSFWGAEVRSRFADSHLGHVFNDGPKPTGLRYCINSAALRFIPVDELDEQGYGEFVDAFER